MTTTKSNADFIAECEEQLGLHGRLTTFQGVPVIFNGGIEKRLEEALQRLKAADANKPVLWKPLTELAKEKENAELKTLLRHARYPHRADNKDEYDALEVRIEEILKTEGEKK